MSTNNVITTDKVDELVADAFLSGETILHIARTPRLMLAAFNRCADLIDYTSESAVIGKTWSSQRCSIVGRSDAGQIEFLTHHNDHPARGRRFDLLVLESVPSRPDQLIELVTAASRLLVVRDEIAGEQ
ncbi:hypothetical protein [Gordonia sp. SND2]|uniref:hypothetical protein n=1 Tax=Gordonia sp. SND2 TaxID=3388659 RepID=UPI00398B3A18